MKKFNYKKALEDWINTEEYQQYDPEMGDLGEEKFSKWLAEVIECSHPLTHYGNSMESEECIFCDCLINHHEEYCKNIEHKAPRITKYLEEV